MKKNTKIGIFAGIMVGFVAGMLLGLSLTNPGISLPEAIGTIGKIDKYRNIKITEADVQLRNTLLENEELREAYAQYFAYEYAANIKMLEDIELAIREATAIPEYYAANAKNIRNLEDYIDFLDLARLRILEAIDALTSLDDRSQIAIQSVLGRAGNAMAQNVMRSSAVFDFLADVEQYLTSVPREDVPGLVLAHDRLFGNLLNTCLVNENRAGLDFLTERRLIGDEEFYGTGFTSDERLAGIRYDADRLQADPGLQFLNQERLNGLIIEDSQSLGIILNQENLQQYIVSNAQNLGLWGMVSDELQLKVADITDSEQLRFDSERLQKFFDTQQLQAFNAQTLNVLINSQEQLRSISVWIN